MGKVLVACEFTGTVRDAFTRAGHDAMSCDIVPSESNGQHYTGDVRDILGDGFDMMVAHPPCTALAVSGAAWFKFKQKEQAEALEFVRLLLAAPIKHIALENPVSIISTRIRKADQYIQPYQFGCGEVKKTGLWLVNLPRLRPTKHVKGRWERSHMMGPCKDRGRERSRFPVGIAEAMADQWGRLI